VVSDAESLMITLDDFIQQMAPLHPAAAAFMQIIHDHMYESNEVLRDLVVMYYQKKMCTPEFQETLDQSLHLIFEP